MMDMEALLLAREERARLQEALLRQWGGALLVHRVNMPGPDKNSPLALQIFSAVEEVLEAAFGDSVRCARQLQTAEGPSGLRILDLPPELLKRQAVALEEGHPLGRLVDLDVHGDGVGSLSRTALGLESRRCYVCGQPAQACARSRQHSLEALLAVMQETWERFDKNGS